MSHDSHKAALACDWLVFFSNMAGIKEMPRMGEGRKALQVRTRADVHAEQELQVLVDPPVPEVEAPPTLSSMEKRIAKAEGRLLESLLAQQLAQMAAEAGPSMSGGEDLVQRKLSPTVGGKAPWKEFLKASKVKKP